MHLALQSVNEFHAKMGFQLTDKLKDDPSEFAYLKSLAELMQQEAKILLEKSRDGDLRYLRAHLMVEELAEVLEALQGANEVSLLDGLADLIYVVVGTACVYDLPLAEAFTEVHRSNMTKEPQDDDPDKHRVRSKGPNFEPPNLYKVLGDHRAK